MGHPSSSRMGGEYSGTEREQEAERLRGECRLRSGGPAFRGRQRDRHERRIEASRLRGTMTEAATVAMKSGGAG